MTCMSCNSSSDATMTLLCFQLFLLKTVVEPRFEVVCHVTSFYALQVSFEQVYYAFAKKPDYLFWTTLQEVTFAFVANWLEQLDSREILCVHRPKILNASSVQGHKNLREWIQSLCSNVVDRPVLATNQSSNDRWVQTLRLNTIQRVLIRDRTVH